MKTKEFKLDYERYKEKQIGRATKKWGKTRDAILDFEVQFRGDWNEIKDIVKTDKIVCMGIKSGAEYNEFKKYVPNADIYGVDIVPKVTEVGKNCYCYDFAYLPVDWQDKFDLLYSNSLDHAYDIDVTVAEWRRVVKKGGHLILVLSTASGIADVDIYQFEKKDISELFDERLFDLVKTWEHKNEFCVLLRKK